MKKISYFEALKNGSATLAIGMALASVPAFAQDAADEADEQTAIVVTGSRIARPDLNSNSPISVVTGDQIQDKGIVNVEQALNQLPQVTPGLNANVNNGGNGTVTVDIRGLGAERTLVLVNGRRMVPSNNNGVVDLNVINPMLIDRVDVVTGGASATYGSDALGGVVNFILKKDFEGVEVSSQFGGSTRGDSESWTIGGMLGGNFADDRGNAIAAVSYTDRGDSFQADREFSRIDFFGGSGTGIAGRLDNQFTNPFATNADTAFNADGSVRNFRNNFDLTDPTTDRYNFAPVNYLQTPLKRFTFSALGHYDITDSIQAFAEGHYIQSNVKLQLAETPATNIFLDPLSPVLSASARALAATRPDPLAPLVFRRRMTEVGPRVQTFKFDVTQLTAGLTGQVFDGWNWEVSYGRGRVDTTQSLENDVSRSRLTSGLNGCPAGSPAGCVVVDAFGPGRLSESAVNFIRIASSVDLFSFNRDNVLASLSGEFGGLPAGDIGFAVGAEYRNDKSNFVPSDQAQTGDLTGFNAVQPISGSIETKEIFGEVNIPLIADVPFVQKLTLALKGRFSDYSTVGGIGTYSVEGEWMPVEGIRVRSTYSRANRAPSVFELFQAGDQDFPQVVDPCFRGQPGGQRGPVAANVATICQLQGLPDPNANILVQTNTQIEATNVGDLNLFEETSDTFTLGVQFTPQFAPRLNISIDYFNISVDNFISRVQGGASGLVAKCFSQTIANAAALAADPFCSLLSRRANGDLLATVPLTNLADIGVSNKLQTRGLDFSYSYAQPLGEKTTLSLSGNVTYLADYKFNGVQQAAFATADFGTLPEFKANSRLTLDHDAFSISLNWQYIGESTDTAGDLSDPDGFVNIKSESYFDLNARFKASDNFEFFGGLQNMFDNQPPVVTAGFAATNTDENLYDVIGRRFFVGAKMSF